MMEASLQRRTGIFGLVASLVSFLQLPLNFMYSGASPPRATGRTPGDSFFFCKDSFSALQNRKRSFRQREAPEKDSRV